MKHYNLKSTVLFLATVFLLSACGGLGKMAKYAETITYNVDPNPLIVKGDSVEININGKFPGKYFNKKAMVELQPKLEYKGSATPFKMVAFQGENAPGNATVIPYENGKNFTYNDKVAFSKDMRDSDLMLHILGKLGNKEQAFDPYKLADGVIMTPLLVMSDDMPVRSKDQFTQVTSHKAEAVIHYLVNSSVVRPTELKDDDIKAIGDYLKANGTKENHRFLNARIEAYASPEGEISLNENLASDRAKSASRAVGDIMRRNKMKFKADEFFVLVPKGEDWEGFKKAMQASSIADKQLILRILEMYNDNAKREQEIRNLAATFVEISDKILPDLRRSEIAVNFEIVGRTDEEIIALARSANASNLNVEEMLYAATLTDDVNEQYAIYKKTSETYGNDHRAFNNMAVIHLMKNEVADAEAKLKQSVEVKESNEAHNNLAIIKRLSGDRKAAMDHLKKAAGAGNEVNYNMGIIDIQNGDYASAVQNMSGYNTFNKALALLLTGNNDAAMQALNQSPEKDTAMGQYLKAIIAARSNDAGTVSSSLKAAYAMDASLKEQAATDLEFRNFQNEIK
jgi:Flp pilus assembly protein TadD